MIRSGEVYVVEPADQFIERTDFTKLDALLANDIAVVSEANKSSNKDEEFDSVKKVPQEFIDVLFSELASPIVPTLEADHREWVHLREGPVHRLVELYPEEKGAWAEGTVSTEGISVSLYRPGRKEPVMVDEFSQPWSEMISSEDAKGWAAFQDMRVGNSDFVLK